MSGLFRNGSVNDSKKMGCCFARPEGPGLACFAAIGLRWSCDDSAGMQGQGDSIWPRPFQLDREGADQLIERGLGGPVCRPSTQAIVLDRSDAGQARGKDRATLPRQQRDESLAIRAGPMALTANSLAKAAGSIALNDS
ncbi:hypothetical protein WBO78_23510 [Bosea sp. CCNWLW174]|uniref:hypothetical protein n=1 Tax=unclassified Bosea (in: a-proteobacteria) TaxID=2653178 RepID=UPI0030154BC9